MTSDATEGARKLIAPYSERIEALEEENRRLRECLSDDAEYARILMGENAKLRQLVRDVALLAALNGCEVTKMQLHAHGGDWRTVWERMAELGVPGTEVES